MNPRKTISVFLLVIWCLSCPFLTPQGWCAELADILLKLPAPLGEDARASLGTVGVARACYPPEVEFQAYAKSKGAGFQKGMGEGFEQTATFMVKGALQSRHFLAFLMLLILTVPAGVVGAVPGGMYGYNEAVPADEAEKVEQLLKDLSAALKLQEMLSEKLLRASWKKTGRELFAIEGYGPAALDEQVEYSHLKDNAVDSVLEASVARFGFTTLPEGPSNPKGGGIGGNDPLLALYLEAHPRLVRLSDNKVLYQPPLKILSLCHKRSEWEADNFKLFFSEQENQMEAIANKIIDDVYITYISQDEIPLLTGMRLYDDSLF